MQIPSTSSEQIRNQFMTLLLAQLRNQDPLSPVQQHEFITQLTQFSSLEGIEQLNEGVARLGELQDASLRQQELLQARQWLGADVRYFREPGDELAVEGKVGGVLVEPEGIRLVVGTDHVPIEQIAAILAPPGEEGPAAAAPPAGPPPNAVGQGDGAVDRLLEQLKELL